jgi:hypothetical protein
MIEKFKTLFSVKSSLICLYLALTIPIPYFSIEELRVYSFMTFILGLILIINITSDYVETSNKKITYKTNFIAKFFGKKSWEILWVDIKSIQSLPTSQGSKVYYFVTKKDEKILLPQRLENFERFLLIISQKTNIRVDEISYLSPLWTYKLLTSISLLMIVGEIISFLI